MPGKKESIAWDALMPVPAPGKPAKKKLVGVTEQIPKEIAEEKNEIYRRHCNTWNGKYCT